MTTRLFVTDPLSGENTLHLEDARLHYLRHVLRLAPGDHILLFNGMDGEWQANIEAYSKKAATLVCTRLIREQHSEPPLTLMCALIKPSRLEILVEKATELGVSHIQPLVSDFCSIRKMNTERLTSHAIEAAEQSERLTVPAIQELLSLREAVQGYDGEILWADESRDQTGSIGEVLKNKNISAILIGPEGGFSDLEKTYLKSQAKVHPVHMGQLILRAETAGIALISAYQSHTGAWR
jgi:16S rRNA (uracil1498-N3)-methyltransferase